MTGYVYAPYAENRAGVVTVTGDLLAQILGFGSGHSVVAARHNPGDETFCLTIRGPSMPLLPEGGEAQPVDVRYEHGMPGDATVR